MFAAAREAITAWPGYAPTPLYSLSALAERAGVGQVLFKDEGPRFGLKSFKALGGAYAVQTLVAEHEGQELTVTCATDGNHGRSVAWGAQTFGCACVIFIHAEVSLGRQRAIEAYGARVVRIDGNYDDSVRAAAKAASENGWHVISDTSYEGYTEVPKRVMAGYGVIAGEIVDELGDAPPPTHMFVQGGVGGFAGAIAEAFHHHWGSDAPRLIVVEPDLAACLLRSAEAGRMVEIPVDEETL
ncbi:MAG: pyridoxal-phosphate dependent enzyme, partial [Rhodospirillaceae bacterium]|nr:pyridoxal-phosphate dependent enzyme [Rhodospirillaceae bacterium]